MTTYTDEINIYNPSAIDDAVDEAGNAYKTVITEVGSTGVKIHPSGQSGSGIVDYTLIDADGMDVFDGGDSVAAFGSVSRIGKSDESHIELDYHSMQMVDSNRNAYLDVSDMRNSSGNLNVTEYFTVSSISDTFIAAYDVYSISDATLNGDDVTSEVTATPLTLDGVYQTSRITSLGPWPGTGELRVRYVTKSDAAKAFTFGSRGSGTVGGQSATFGYGNKAMQLASFAEGFGTVADGPFSHAQNFETVAASSYQTALGKYNVSDANEEYAVIVGNGTANDARSDALRVDWQGNVRLAGGIQDMSGNPLIQAVEAESASATNIAAGSYGSCTATLPTPSGYEVIGITGIKTNNQNMLDVNSWSMSGNTVTAYLHNFSSASQAAKITVYAKCINSSLS